MVVVFRMRNRRKRNVSGEAKSSVPAVQTTITPTEGALSVQPGEIMALTLINLVNY